MERDIASLKTSVSMVIKWMALALIVGILVGFVASVFCLLIDWATSFRNHNLYIVLLLPIAGILTVLIAKAFHDNSNIDTVMSGINTNKSIPIALTPVVMISTFLSHLFGASVGREGAALQFGGSLGNFLGKYFDLDDKDKKIVILCGMSAAFSALFDTPIAGALFPIAFCKVGNYPFAALLPCMVAALISNEISHLMGNVLPSFTVDVAYTSSFMVFQIVPLALLAGITSAVFCILLVKSGDYMKKWFKDPYVRIVFGSVVMIILTCIVGSSAYLGLGMDTVSNSFDFAANPSAFMWKIIFTCLVVSVGFRGGELAPSFFIGATLGSALAPIIGLPIDLCAACGMVAVFCGVTNSPLTSIIMAIELFGADGLPFYALAIAISFVSSGYYSLYKQQDFAFSKYVFGKVKGKRKKMV